jgi:hypothetical protein
MQSFSIKTIGLYALAIGAATCLFSAIASYGEANIRAPQANGGKYALGRNLSGCLQGREVELEIQQSGIYLHGSVAISNAKSDKKDNQLLTGKLIDRQLFLTGKLPAQICPQQSQFDLNGTIDNRQLNGKVALDRQLISPVSSKGVETRSTKTDAH